MATLIKDGKLLYHQTSIKNLQSIIEKGLLSREDLIKKGISFVDVANPDIIEGRKENSLEKYVPFHFHPRTPFDYKIRTDHPDESFMYLTMLRTDAKKAGALVLPAHPLSTENPKIYGYDEGIKAIDWDTMEIKQGQKGYNRQIRMAECLFESPVYITSVWCIYVKNDEDKEYVQSILDDYEFVVNDSRYMNILVQPKFF